MGEKLLSDREKLEKWDEICQERGWSVPRELDERLAKNGIYFTGAGSCVNIGPVAFRLENVSNTKVVVNSSDAHELALFIMQSLCGLLLFTSVEVETKFWELSQQRMLEDSNLELPDSIVPRYIRNKSFAKKDKDDDNKSPDEGQKES